MASPTLHPVIRLTPGEEAAETRVSAGGNSAACFAVPLLEPSLITLFFTEASTASRCVLYLSCTDPSPSADSAVWRLTSPEPKKTLTIHPADDNYQLGSLYVRVCYAEESGSAHFRLRVTLQHTFFSSWFRRMRCVMPSSSSAAAAAALVEKAAAGGGGTVTGRGEERRAVTTSANGDGVSSEPGVGAEGFAQPLDETAATAPSGPPSLSDREDCTPPATGTVRRNGGRNGGSRSTLYIGAWKGARYHGRGVMYYGLSQDCLLPSGQSLLEAVYEQHGVPWSARSLTEDPLNVLATATGDFGVWEGLERGVVDLDRACGWSVIAPIEDGVEVFDGYWENGEKCGLGVYQWRDRAYVGQWTCGQREGYGVLERADGTWYCGEWHADRRHGHGEALFLPAGTTYRGEWYRGLRHGPGSLTYPNGVVVTGVWNNDEQEPEVCARYADGSVYEGSWQHDTRHGSGVYTDAQKCVHSGTWSRDVRCGAGDVRFPNGVVLRATWDELGTPHDMAYHFANGDVYDGDWDGVRLVREGKGTCRYCNGDVYEGDWHDDRRHGRGTMRYAHDKSTYTGDWEADQRSGHGCLTSPIGTYDGEFVRDEQCGHGEFRGVDGSHYTGRWRGNCRTGAGVFYDAPTDTTYEGIFLYDRLQGVGKSAHGGRQEAYEGCWLDGLKQGHGTHTFANGDSVRGVWHRGVPQDGTVTYHHADGGHYLGDWKDGHREGRGTQTYEDGSVYEGHWVDNNRHGRGRLTKPDGHSLECDWQRGKTVDGAAVIGFVDGSVYEGEHRGGVPHGMGVLVYPDCTVFRGRFRNGIYEL